MSTIYVLGNPMLKEDALPLRLLPILKKSFPRTAFVELDPTENLPEGRHIILLDTVINATKVTVITDVDKIAQQAAYSLHDFDLGLSLKLMKKLGKIKDVTIIGVPQSMTLEEALRELEKIIPSVLSGNARRS